MSKKPQIINFNPFFCFFSYTTIAITMLISLLVFPIIYRIKIKKIKNRRKIKAGAIIVSNHCTYFDPALVSWAVWPRIMHLSGTEKSFKVKGLNIFLRLLRGFPIPANNPKKIVPYVKKALQKKHFVHFFAEGDLFDYNQEVNTLKNGAFFFSLRENKPIIPIAIVLKKHYFFKKEITKPFPKIIIDVGEPLYPEDYKSKSNQLKLQMQSMSEDCRNNLQSQIDKNGGDKTLYSGQIIHRI